MKIRTNYFGETNYGYIYPPIDDRSLNNVNNEFLLLFELIIHLYELTCASN